MIGAMPAAPDHRCRVTASPWAGLYGTQIDSAREFGRHWHATYGLGLLERGAQSSASGRGQVDARAGDLITTNPGEVHDGRPLGGARRWRMLYLDPQLMHSMSAPCVAPSLASAGSLELVRPVIRDARLQGLLLRLFARLDRWNQGQAHDDATLACEEALVQVCAQLLERHSTQAPAPAVSADLARVRERLADDPQRAPSLDELAAPFGLTKYQLLRRFQRAYGLPPHAWLVQQRVERARDLIRRGRSLTDAAADSGFADQSHMTRAFARQFGFTPGAWQRAAAPRRPRNDGVAPPQ